MPKFLRAESINETYGKHQVSVMHLLAAFARPEVFIHFADNFPQLMNAKDNQGNTFLHFAASNEDYGEEIFKHLVDQGADIFAQNLTMETPIKTLVAAIEKRDPLTLDRRDIYLFIGDYLPSILLASGLPVGALVAELLSLKAFISVLRDHSKFGAFPLLYILTNMVPIVRLPLRAWITYQFVKRAYLGVQTARPHITHRPLRALANSVVHVSNATHSVNQFRKLLKIDVLLASVAEFSYRFFGFFDSVNEKCFGNQGLDINSKNIVSQLDCSATEFEKTFKTELEYDEAVHQFYMEKVKPNVVDLTKFTVDTNENCVDGKNPLDNFPKFTNCTLDQFENTFKHKLDDQETKEFYFEKAKPFIEESSRSCTMIEVLAQGAEGVIACVMSHYEFYFGDLETKKRKSEACLNYETPEGLGNLDLKNRILAVGDHSSCLKGAEDIIGQSLAESCKLSKHDFRKFIKAQKVQLHPDTKIKSDGSYNYADLALNLGQAHELIKNECEVLGK